MHSNEKELAHCSRSDELGSNQTANLHIKTPAKYQQKSVQRLIIHRGRIRGVEPSEAEWWLEIADRFGKQIIWWGPTRADAVEMARWIAGDALRIVDAGGAI